MTLTSMRLDISIHAPSRERPGAAAHVNKLRLFQSTLPRGSDLSSALQAAVSRQFQSTLPRGSDLR